LATTVGGSVRVADIEYGMDPTVRLLRRDRNLLEAAQTKFTLANRQTRMTDLVQAGITKPVTDPTTALVSFAGSAAALTAPPAATPVTIFTAAATIPAGSTVTTPSTQVLTVEPGAGVTYIPAAPTSPSTGVTVATAGAPPRPRRLK